MKFSNSPYAKQKFPRDLARLKRARSLWFILLNEELIDLNHDLDLDLNLSPHTFRSELARINPINIETIWYS